MVYLLQNESRDAARRDFPGDKPSNDAGSLLFSPSVRGGIFIRLLMVLSVIFSCYCDKGTDPMSLSYSKILLERKGGGDKAFYVTTNEGHEIFISVVRYNFSDTNFTTSFFVEDDGRLSNLIADVINGKAAITGDFRQPTSATGTWVSLYAVSDGDKRYEITNTTVREELLRLESLVDSFVQDTQG
jgi:hypothetical protein